MSSKEQKYCTVVALFIGNKIPGCSCDCFSDSARMKWKEASIKIFHTNYQFLSHPSVKLEEEIDEEVGNYHSYIGVCWIYRQHFYQIVFFSGE